MEKPILRLTPDNTGTSFFFLAVLLTGGIVTWLFSFWIFLIFVIALVLCWYLILRTYVFLDFYESHVLVKRNFSKMEVQLPYSDIEVGKYYFSQGKGNILFQLKFSRSAENIGTVSYSQAGIDQFKKVAKLLLEKNVPFNVTPVERTQEFLS